MSGAIIDTNMFVSFINKKDQNHKIAYEIFDRVRRGEFGQPYTSDYVFDEALTVALMRTRRLEESIKIGKLILGSKSEGIPALARLVHVDERTFEESWNVFQSRKYSKLSFTDHTLLSQMKAYHLEYLISFDTGFDGLVTRIGS
jgi:uncharacterized protein